MNAETAIGTGAAGAGVLAICVGLWKLGSVLLSRYVSNSDCHATTSSGQEVVVHIGAVPTPAVGAAAPTAPAMPAVSAGTQPANVV